ncbi:MAG: chorismate synthase [Candidatus Gastranaerophilales bacterium]|nr:chorismate synthase [Candidatus Gastranaerophilales bacterium]
MNKKFRFLTSGESHGKCLTAIIEGVPAGFPISVDEINVNLSRRQQGYGRGGRMKIETDKVEIKSGIRHGVTTGAPICLEVKNKDYENWEAVMTPDEVNLSDENIKKLIDEKTFTKLRPGHADYAGSVKYAFQDLRNVLERSSARKTAVEVAVGSVAQQILKQFDIEGCVTVTRIGKVYNTKLSPDFDEVKRLADESEVRCWDVETSKLMKEEIDKAKLDGNTLGGEFEVVYRNLPVGLGSYVHYDRALDGLLAQAVMSIPAVKSVEIGAGKLAGELYGSEMHDAIYNENDLLVRKTNNAGGIEGGMTNGENVVVRGVMKPIPTMIKPLPTVDISDNSNTEAHFERSDTCAVPACAVVAEARVAIVLVDEFLDKFGGDSLTELKAHYEY